MTITWEDFLTDICNQQLLTQEQIETVLTRFPKENSKLSENELGGQLHLGEQGVGARMTEIYKKFEPLCEELRTKKGGKVKCLQDFLRQQYRNSCGSIVPPQPKGLYSDEFKALIQEKIERFCGRKFVFDAFDQFIQDHSKGYFTVIGDAGMGKTALAAKLVSEQHYPHYFNILAQSINTPESFLRSIRGQLIGRYGLENAEADNLPELLEKVSQKLPAGERLILVIDALDEVNQELGSNLLYLPMTLPERVYIFLTRRPYTLRNKRLNLSPGVPFSELDLREEKYMKLSEIDIKAYIQLFLQDPEHRDNLQHWIAERTTTEEFVEQVADKSENNFMYLRYLLPVIAKGQYNDLQLAELPKGLEEYYQTHWVRMGMEDAPQEFMVIILFILKEVGTPIPSEMIAQIAEQDEAQVEQVLDRWFEYLRMQHQEGECCYSIYHASFLNFLEKQTALKKNRQLFREVNQRIADYLEGEME